MGQTYRWDRIASVYTDRDDPHPVEAVAEHLSRLGRRGADALAQAHAERWRRSWDAMDVTIEGDVGMTRALRFAAYHLLSATNPEDETVSVGARALTGAAYKGHVFWDTEIYMLPFYALTLPAAARSLLMFRFNTLHAAKARAASLGYAGALYPWESARDGRDATPPFAVAPDGEILPILSAAQEHHISADIAYAVWQYFQATGDDDFLWEAGAEMLFETARFWTSRGRVEEDGHFHIRNVMGPDEYHDGVDDDAYTNSLAQYNLERAAEVADLLEARRPDAWPSMAVRLGVTGEERRSWVLIARAMATHFDEHAALHEQFAGYFALEEVDLSPYRGRPVAMDVVLGRERCRRSNVLKQADVVLLLHLLWDRFSAGVREADFRYYEARTSHGSSLSPPVHAAVAARLGDMAMAERYLRETADIDLADNMGNAAGGVHAGALGGLWQAVVLGFAGVSLRSDGLALAPRIPPSWQKLSFPLRWRGRQIRASVSSAPKAIELAVEADAPAPVTISIEGAPGIVIGPGRAYRLQEERTGWGAWREITG